MKRQPNHAEIKRLTKIPHYLIPGLGKFGRPGMIKRHVAHVCEPIDHHWRLFAEGCLRNKFFRNMVLKQKPKCKACHRKLDSRSRIEMHHLDYLWACDGEILPEDSPDIHRAPYENEYKQVPNCRKCFADNPNQFWGCQNRISPVHAACHERIHDKEHYFRMRARKKLIQNFDATTQPKTGRLGLRS
ncbi:MAG: hypothetical protein AAF583_02705 [Pseudomonadota bacterium]